MMKYLFKKIIIKDDKIKDDNYIESLIGERFDINRKISATYHEIKEIKDLIWDLRYKDQVDHQDREKHIELTLKFDVLTKKQDSLYKMLRKIEEELKDVNLYY